MIATNIKNITIANYSSLYADFCDMLNIYREHANNIITPQCLDDIMSFCSLPNKHHDRAMKYLCDNYPLSITCILNGDYSKNFEELLHIMYQSMMSEAFSFKLKIDNLITSMTGRF